MPAEENPPERRWMDEVCESLQRQWKAGVRPQIEFFLEDAPADLGNNLVGELIALELKLRQEAGEQADVSEYLERFPANSETVRAAFAAAETGIDSEDCEPPPAASTPGLPDHVGPFRILRRLGEGAFGEVYEAHDSKGNRTVALKVLLPARAKNAADRERFLAEAQRTMGFCHPRIVAVYGINDDFDRPYIVQEFVDGCDLKKYVQQAQLKPDRIVELLVGIADALAYIHTRNLYHRDLKPANILIDSQGQPKVADFGLAMDVTHRWEHRGELAGSLAYMSREQIRGEPHLVTGSSDVWSLGVIMYELLTNELPFPGESTQDALRKIESIRSEIEGRGARGLREVAPDTPAELQRICLKCLARETRDRYPSAADLLDDLRQWKSAPLTLAGKSTISAPSDTPVVKPLFLEPFTEKHSDFFLDLLPGVRDRDGIPDSISFWKTKIEQGDPDETFRVGLMYGPSGCGKSSLVQAGLLPRLSDDILPVYIEATAEETEVRLINALRKRCPELPPDGSLPELIAYLRASGGSRGCKVLLVLDQFEQWLHARESTEDSQLVSALRQCDGRGLQCLVLVRDDFWMSVTSFMQVLEVPVAGRHNSASVERFDRDHARKVLTAFGRAYGKLPTDPDEEQIRFLKTAVEGLADDGKVICVRLAVFAEMMKGRPWTIESLRAVGGTEGVGVSFLEETFSAKSAPPLHRLKESAVRAVLKELLPPPGTDIKGQMKSYDELLALEGSSYFQRHDDLDTVLSILNEVRLITPTEPDETEAQDTEQAADTHRYYQLTHDFLVPSLRKWLTREQKKTRGGRAKLRLAELSSAWNAKPETRHLPSVLEWLSIRLFTCSRARTSAQRKMMATATRTHAARWGGIFSVLLVVGVAIQQYVAFRDRQSDELARQTDIRTAKATVDSLQMGTGQVIPLLLEKLDLLPRELVLRVLQSRFAGATGQQKLSLAYGLARFDQVEVDEIVAGIVDSNTQSSELGNVLTALELARGRALEKLKSAASEAEKWRAKTRLAVVAMHLRDISIAAEMLRTSPDGSLFREMQNPAAELPARLATAEQKPLEEYRSREAQHNIVSHARVEHYYYLDAPRDSPAVPNEVLTNDSVLRNVLMLQAVCLARDGFPDAAGRKLDRLSEEFKKTDWRPFSITPYLAFAEILTKAWLGEHDEAERLLEELADDSIAGANRGYGTYAAACIASQMARVHGDDQPSERDRLMRRAVELLRRAHFEFGWGSQDIVRDLDLAPLFDNTEFRALAFELAPWDPVQRTVFIAEFPDWCGDIERLAGMLQETDDSDVRSGISLAIGSIERPDPQAKETWGRLLAEWYSDKSDSVTHSATSWALRHWGIRLPPVEQTLQPSVRQDWWHTPAGLTMVRIPDGVVTSGRSRNHNDRTIVIDSPFWLSDREISTALYREFVADAPPELRLDSQQYSEVSVSPQVLDSLPATNVSWEDACFFCNWLSGKHGFEECYKIERLESPVERDGYTMREHIVIAVEGANGFRLSMSDEWEYACRARATTDFGCGDDPDQLQAYAVFRESKREVCGSLLCNSWGIFDMHGNVWEWQWDDDIGHRRIRGGGFDSGPGVCESGRYQGSIASSGASNAGFRVALGPYSGDGNRNTLANILFVAGFHVGRERYSEAEQLYKEVLEKLSRMLGDDHATTLSTMTRLASLHQTQGKFKEAETLLKEVLRTSRRVQGGNHDSTLAAMEALASFYAVQNRNDDAKQLYENLIERARLESSNRRLAGALATLSRLHIKQRSYGLAASLASECITIREEEIPNDWGIFNAKSLLGEALAGQQIFAEAERLLIEGYQGIEQRKKNISSTYRNARLTDALERLVSLYDSWDKPELADQWRLKLEKLKSSQ